MNTTLTIEREYRTNGFYIEREYVDGNLVHIRRSNGFSEQREYNEHGDLTHLKSSTGYEVTKRYHEKSNRLTYYKDSKGTEKTFIYDDSGNKMLKAIFRFLNFEETFELLEGMSFLTRTSYKLYK